MSEKDNQKEISILLSLSLFWNQYGAQLEKLHLWSVHAGKKTQQNTLWGPTADKAW